jgi:hypothetical protein
MSGPEATGDAKTPYELCEEKKNMQAARADRRSPKTEREKAGAGLRPFRFQLVVGPG